MRIFKKLKKFFSMRWDYIIPLTKQAHKESARSYLSLILDLKKSMKQGYTWCEYFDYGFQFNRAESYRRSFVATNIHYKRLAEIIAKRADLQDELNFEDKGVFNKIFSDLRGIKSLDLREASFFDFCDFVHEKQSFVAKEPMNYGGYGVSFFELASQEEIELRALYEELLQKGLYVIEETIKQHPMLNKLSLNSVNTLRVVTVKNVDGSYSVPFVTSRISVSEARTDNGSTGGAWSNLNSKGEVIYDYFSDVPILKFYSKHPVTGFVYQSFVFPYYQEAISLCLEAAKRIKCPLLGFDIAICQKGPVIIECNRAPGPSLYQVYTQLKDEIGLLEELEKALGFSLSS